MCSTILIKLNLILVIGGTHMSMVNKYLIFVYLLSFLSLSPIARARHRAATSQARRNNGFPHRRDAGRGSGHVAMVTALPVWHVAAGLDKQCGAERLVRGGEGGLRKISSSPFFEESWGGFEGLVKTF